MKELNSSIS